MFCHIKERLMKNLESANVQVSQETQDKILKVIDSAMLMVLLDRAIISGSEHEFPEDNIIRLAVTNFDNEPIDVHGTFKMYRMRHSDAKLDEQIEEIAAHCGLPFANLKYAFKTQIVKLIFACQNPLQNLHMFNKLENLKYQYNSTDNPPTFNLDPDQSAEILTQSLNLINQRLAIVEGKLKLDSGNAVPASTTQPGADE